MLVGFSVYLFLSWAREENLILGLARLQVGPKFLCGLDILCLIKSYVWANFLMG